MNCLVYTFYMFIIGLIHVYKWLELQVLRLIFPLVRRKGREICGRVGIVFHCPDDPEYTEADNERALAKCKQHDTLIHITVHDNAFITKSVNWGGLGGGNAYMDKMWDARSEDEMVEFLRRLMEAGVYNMWWNFSINRFITWVTLEAFNLQTKSRAFQVGKKHYDLGNDLYKLMLDRNMQYTCGYWAHADNLDQAQVDKMELIAKKLDLKPGMRVLDIGCGWGYLCKYLAEKYQVECVGVTISEEGVAYGKDLCKGLPVDIRLQDYREVDEKFDRIVSVGMFEHVGRWNYREYMKIVNRCLHEDGIFLLQTIGTNHPIMPQTELWMHKNIFPNGSLPRATDITTTTYGLFIIEDWHNFGTDYARTLHAWRDNFNRNWDLIKDKYGERFYRMWTIYLMACEAFFLARKPQLWQIVMSKHGLTTGYRAAR